MRQVFLVAAGLRAAGRVPAGVCVALTAAMSASEACAAALPVSLTSSLGLFATLVMWLVAKTWPAQLAWGALPAAGSLLVCGAGAAWLWRARAAATGGSSSVSRGSGGWGLARKAIAARGRTPAAVTLPVGIEAVWLLSDLRRQFVLLQAAWDMGEVGTLRALVTPQMLDQLRESWPCCGGTGNRTDVVTLHAELLGFEALGEGYLVTVEFSGLIRESAHEGAAPFREMWMLIRPMDDPRGWKLARHQALL